MKTTFTTTLPDRVGTFYHASKCISSLGLNITRVSYNKAVDAHMLFIEVEGSEEKLALAEQELENLGYLHDGRQQASVLLVEFHLEDKPGALLPVLELIRQFDFNISYMSSQQTGEGHQDFKMGLYMEDGRNLSKFMRRAALLCPVKILEYDKSERTLDNTVFYLSFANEISAEMGLNEGEKQKLLVHSNQIMQALEERNSPPYKTFDYIGKIAEHLKRYKGEGFVPRISRQISAAGMEVLLIEPPCGSNTVILTTPEGIVAVDSGFSCYRRELKQVLAAEVPDFDRQHKVLMLTHGDVDHCGAADLFDEVVLSRMCLDDLNGGDFREEHPVHAPYVRISKLLSAFSGVPLENCRVVDDREVPGQALLEQIGTFSRGGLTFEVWQGLGGHVRGEVIYIERTHRLAFTGDIFVNIKGFSDEQKAYNCLAPYLMTSVDTDPVLARAEREAFKAMLEGDGWLIYGGHGGALPFAAPQ